MSSIDIAKVREWGKECGEVALHYFNNVARERKADHTWVTEADVEIEKILRKHIGKAYSSHGVMGEEEGLKGTDREFVWAIDPIDGTGSFVAGLPTWCVSIGVLHNGKPYSGVINVPLLGDEYWADAEGPAYRNDEQITVNAQDEIDYNDWIAVTSHAHSDYRIEFPAKTRVLGSIAIDFCYVARGSARGAIVRKASLWDMAAGLAILHGAGGVVQTLAGELFDASTLLDGSKAPTTLILAAPAMMKRLREQITEVSRDKQK